MTSIATSQVTDEFGSSKDHNNEVSLESGGVVGRGEISARFDTQELSE